MVEALIAAGITAAGSAYSNARNEGLSRENRYWQEYMSNTAYRRAVEDMREAGLNPMLAYSQGGASTPAGNVAEVDSITGDAVGSAMQARRLKQELRNMKAQEEKTYSDESLSRQLASTEYTRQDLNTAQKRLVNQQLRLLGPELSIRKADAAMAQQMEKLWKSDAGQAAAMLQMFRNAIFGGSGIMAPIRSSSPSQNRR